MDMFDLSLALVSVLAGAVAAIAGFGIGSLLTPLLALKTGMGLAVAAICVAHFLGTALRFWLWKKYINKQILFSFGLMSALGGLSGALFHTIFQNVVLTVILGALLIFAGFSGLTGISEKWRLTGKPAWIAGALSGIFGGLVGNQGGIRSAAMFGFHLKTKEFVATATGIALIVDIVRLPVYCAVQWREMLAIWPWIAIASIGVLIGTEIGVQAIGRVSESVFKKVLSAIILVLGVFILIYR